MKDSTKKAVDKAIDNYRGDMVDAATDVAIEAHISGDIAAHATMGIPIGKMEVQKEALLFGKKYKKLLKETGGTIIRGKRIDWLASHTEDTRKAVYETIRSGLIEGKPVADIGGKLGVPGTVAHDLEKLIIRDAKYKYVRIARTETAAIQNQGTLNRFKKNKITHVEVIDGTDFDEACAEANGQTWTVEYAASHELEHPNCTRSFSPVIPDDWEVPDEVEITAKPKASPRERLKIVKAPVTKIAKKTAIKPDLGMTKDLMDAKMYNKRGSLGNAMKNLKVDPDEYLSHELKIDLGITSKDSIGVWRKATDDWLKANPRNPARNNVIILRRQFLRPSDVEMKNLMFNKVKSKKTYLETGKAKYVDDANALMKRLTDKEFPGLEDVLTKTIVYKEKGRALFDPKNKVIRLYEGDKKRTVMHEFGHAIEKSDPKIYEAMVKFRRSKSSGQKAKLSEITKNPNYEFHEIALKDDYLDPYVGKVYDRADKVTEVMSMGLEQFESTTSAIDFYINQPEHFKAIMKVLKE